MINHDFCYVQCFNTINVLYIFHGFICSLCVRVYVQVVYVCTSICSSCVCVYEYMLKLCMCVRVYAQCVYVCTSICSMCVCVYEYMLKLCIHAQCVYVFLMFNI